MVALDDSIRHVCGCRISILPVYTSSPRCHIASFRSSSTLPFGNIGHVISLLSGCAHRQGYPYLNVCHAQSTGMATAIIASSTANTQAAILLPFGGIKHPRYRAYSDRPSRQSRVPSTVYAHPGLPCRATSSHADKRDISELAATSPARPCRTNDAVVLFYLRSSLSIAGYLIISRSAFASFIAQATINAIDQTTPAIHKGQRSNTLPSGHSVSDPRRSGIGSRRMICCTVNGRLRRERVWSVLPTLPDFLYRWAR